MGGGKLGNSGEPGLAAADEGRVGWSEVAGRPSSLAETGANWVSTSAN